MGAKIRVIWIAPKWRHLQQACDHFSDLKSWVPIARFGGDSNKLPIPEVNLGMDFDGVVLTTVHTYYELLRSNRNQFTASLLIWDECHWSQTSKMGRLILGNCEQNKTHVLGLTATPLNNGVFYVAYHLPLLTLLNGGYLAKPIIDEPVDTGIDWMPGIDFHGDFDTRSLRELSTNPKRNRLITEHYIACSHKFGQTLIFACNVEHADLLVQAFQSVGVAVAPIHSGVPEKQREQFLEEFCNQSVRVLVTVEMLTQGIDLPVIKSIFLCRPTTSDILFAQMIGRGTRKHPGKSDFYIVEFTDNIKSHIDLLITAKTYFRGAGPNRTQIDGIPDNSSRRKQYHGFDPEGLPTWVPEDPSLPASIQGLWFRRGQTFGIEFELMCPDMPDIEPSDPEWWDIAAEILSAIRSATEFVAEEPIGGYSGVESGFLKDCSIWNVEYDSTAGFEVTTRILSGIDGYLEVDRVCEALDKVIPSLGLDVNYETATHVHFGWDSQSPEELRRLVRLVRLAESGLGTLVAPSRLADFDGQNYNLKKPNSYCKPVSYIASEADITSWKSLKQVEEAFSDRYVTVNLKSLFKQGTVEVRMHSATIEARKILLWISFWQQLFWAASVDRVIPATEDHYIIQPDGDIVEFARTYLPSDNEPLQAAFLRHLDNRRREILEIWRQSSILSAWTKFRVNWKAVA